MFSVSFWNQSNIQCINNDIVFVTSHFFYQSYSFHFQFIISYADAGIANKNTEQVI